MSSLRPSWPFVVLAGAAAWLYWGVGSKLVADWAHDDNYSHGFLIVPLAMYFVWERRERLRRLPVQPAFAGLAVFVASLLVLAAGLLGAELFLTRVSIIGVLAGTVLYLFGWQHLKTLAFPLLFLLLMIPLPAIVFNQIAFPLQVQASRFGAFAIQACGVPVLREGNVIVLANTSLEVAEACSGIRSLVSLLTLGILYGYFTDHRSWVRTVVAGATIPIAILANGFRVAGTGVLAHYWGPEAAMGFFHEFSGWLVFVVALVMLFLFVQGLRRLMPEPLGETQPAGAAA